MTSHAFHVVVWHHWLAKEFWLSGYTCILPGFNPCLHSFYSYTHDHAFVVHWCGVHWTLCGQPGLCCYHPKKWKMKKNLVEYVQLS